ncbi:MAG: GTPase HflX [bacterium]|nr:GTPase HflX [bacterium]
MKELFGNTTGLKSNQISRLEKIYRRKISPSLVTTSELASYLLEMSKEIGRQIGVLIDRNGHIDYVAIGDSQKILLPDFGRLRAGEGRFRGLRFVHTHLKEDPINRDDLIDLAILRLDIIASIYYDSFYKEARISIAHLLPQNIQNSLWNIIEPQSIYKFDLNFSEFIDELEKEFARYTTPSKIEFSEGRAVLVHVSNNYNKIDAEESLNELKELSNTAGVEVVDVIIQFRKKFDPKYFLGKGKLEEVVMKSLQFNAQMIIFDQDLTSTQARMIGEMTDLKVLDRTQIILDIFAKRAQSSDGKLQVELAQLKYLLPRLTRQDDGLSRLTGGIGARGPGETKLEIDRRRVRDRLRYLELKLKNIAKSRRGRRMQRKRQKIPVVAIIGYTNAGKSTLLNSLTSSSEYTDNRLFATLDPHARLFCYNPYFNKKYSSKEKYGVEKWDLKKVILIDTVGFIHRLPKGLISAFKATLEELEDASLFLHVIDGSSQRYAEHIKAVEEILSNLNFAHISQLLVINKLDKINQNERNKFIRQYQGLVVSALTGEGLEKIKKKIYERLFIERI